jgi:hypothetical protein
VSAHCCPLVIALLRALGCEHAAKMHEQPDAEWTPDDLLVHMAEERWHLWPVLRRHGMAIRVLGRLSPSGARLLEAHSEREDRAVGALLQLPEIRALLGA